MEVRVPERAARWEWTGAERTGGPTLDGSDGNSPSLSSASSGQMPGDPTQGGQGQCCSDAPGGWTSK